MTLIVQKYGGHALRDLQGVRQVARRVADFHAAGQQLVVVVSAMAGETDRLIALAGELAANPEPRELDVLLATGEQVAVGLVSMALRSIGVDAKSYLGGQVRILTDREHTQARILGVEAEAIRGDLQSGKVVVVAGFQGVDADGNITTLGRGGADATGVALAAALGADECQIHTDIDGVYTADPHVVPDARKLDRITFEEMLELTSLGSRVLQLRAVEFAGKHKVKLRVLSCEQEGGEGTLITFDEGQDMEQPHIAGIAFNRDEAKITLLGVRDKPGIAYQILGPVAAAKIDVDMIIQNVGHDGMTDFSFTVRRDDLERAMAVLEAIREHVGARAIEGDKTMAKVSVVGVGMRSHPGVASLMFRTLAEEGINIQMISTSEIKISVAIDEKYVELAARVLHKAFGLESSA